VTNSIYTDKEVFLRELVSNAADAVEKLRHLQVTGVDITDPEIPLQISITADKNANTLTIQDAGCGMSKAEMVENLGTIAHSGSKAFIKGLKDSGESSDAMEGIIGKFGVGFYAAFMVGAKVEVYSKAADPAEPAHCWTSDGSGSYTIAEASGVQRGSKIVIHMKEDASEYTAQYRIDAILKKYSNFVNYPILLNDTPVNTVQAIWTRQKSDVTEDELVEFYQYIAKAFDEPAYTLQFQADAPIALKTLFFAGSQHSEKYGQGRMEAGVSLYCRKVLVEANSKDVLPDWLRFIKGVVDSEDLPLSISREKMQDTRLLVRIREVITRRLLRFFEQEMKNDREKYETFFSEFGSFFKEGVCTDFASKETIAKMLLYESSKNDPGKLTSLDEYIGRCTPTQDKIYFLLAPNREMAEASPYYETFRKNNTEVLFLYQPMDDFVMNNLAEFNGRKLVTAETTDLDLGEDDSAAPVEIDEDVTAMVGWMKAALDGKVADVKTTTRLEDSPAIVTDHESAALRRMMRMVDQQQSGAAAAAPASGQLEINANHVLIKQLAQVYDKDAQLAERVAEQILDNALMTAGLMDDPRAMVPRLNELLLEVLKGK
jgi:HSP90 family molecular chaperone